MPTTLYPASCRAYGATCGQATDQNATDGVDGTICFVPLDTRTESNRYNDIEGKVQKF